MEAGHPFSGFLNMDDFLEELPPGDYNYALNVTKSLLMSSNDKLETTIGQVLVNSTYLENFNAYCGKVLAPKDDIAYLFFYNTTHGHTILQLSPSTNVFNITNATTINNSTTITYATNTSVAAGQTITGAYLQPSTIVVSVINSTSCIISLPATGNGSSLTFVSTFTTNTVSLVLRYMPLNFSPAKANRITGFALGNNLYFTDNYSEPKCVNLSRYTGGQQPANIEEVYMIKRGPRYAPNLEFANWGKFNDGSGVFNNNIYQDVQFATQYQYVDGQLSVLSPYSPMVRKLYDSEAYNIITVRLTQDLATINCNFTSGSNTVTCASTIGLYAGVYLVDPTGTYFPKNTRVTAVSGTAFYVSNNALATSSVTFLFQHTVDTVPSLVTQINLFAKLGQTGVFFQVGSISRSLGGSFPANNWINYNGQSTGNLLDPHYLQQFENLPQLVGTMCAAGNRSWIGNYTEGYAKYDKSNISFGGVTVYQYFPTPTSPGYSTFSEISSYQIGFVLRDANGRTMGVLTDQSYNFKIPVFTQGLPVVNIPQLGTTVLSNLPSWVYDVGIVITKDTNKTSYIKDTCRNGQWVYMTSSITAGIATTQQNFSLTYPAAGAKFFALDISAFANAGKYYTWQQGDRVVFYSPMFSTYTTDLPIEAFDGTYIYCGISALLNTNNGITLTNTSASNLEAIIYSPPSTSLANIFYEHPNESWIPYNIPETTLQTVNTALHQYNWGSYYQVYSGTCTITPTILEGDSMLGFSSYLYSAGPPAKNLCMLQMRLRGSTVWNTSIGRPFVQTVVDLAQKQTYVRYGGTYVSGTSVNQLAEFSGASENNISPNAGTLQKLQPTVRDSSQSNAILAICNTDTYSIYINEAIITTGNANSIVSSSVNVIGDVRQQQSGYGTLHPESVVSDAYGNIYWFDTLQKSYVRYSGNGIFPISSKKMSTYFYFQALANQGNEFVSSGYDPVNETIYVSFNNVYGGGNINGDQTKQTVGFRIPDDRWIGFFTFWQTGLLADYVSGSKNMYFVLGNSIWRHTTDAVYTNFQNSQYNCTVSASVTPLIAPRYTGDTNLWPVKTPNYWKVIKIQASPNFFSWSAGKQYVNDPNFKITITNKDGQVATLSNNRPSGEQEFEAEENIIYAVIKYDENSINKNTGVVDSSSCLYGDPIVSNSLQITLTWTGGKYNYIRSISVGYEPSRGNMV